MAPAKPGSSYRWPAKWTLARKRAAHCAVDRGLVPDQVPSEWYVTMTVTMTTSVAIGMMRRARRP